ncbi:sensor histidine kinase [Albidovulum sp.]|uniref:sensor histidine kinase n=1 Tax=Albidovulum sp. TaxID=1872424 RepID=UPI0039B897F8
MFATSSLGFRLASTLVLALLPLGLLSIVQAWASLDQTDRATLNGIGGASIEAVRPQMDMIRDAKTTARMLATGLSVGIPPDTNCVARMRTGAATNPTATLVAYIPMSGRTTCTSTGTTIDFAGDPLFARMTAKPEPTLAYGLKGPVSGAPVIGVAEPVIDAAADRQTGVVAILLRHRSVLPAPYVDSEALWKPALLATYTGDGTLLSATTDAAGLATLVSGGVALDRLDMLAGRPFYSEGVDGRRRIVSVTSVASDLFLLAVWERENDGLWATAAVAPFLLPALTWAAALFAASVASSRFVVRHVRSLSRAMNAYMASRTRAPVPHMDEAPTEIRKLHAVYEELIRTIEHDEAELQNLLVDKDTLLKEVHHRSGNSLQIIASVMRMYRRETADADLRAVLGGLINRVIALSSTHTSLYSLGGRRDVPMDEILFAVIRRLKEIHGIAPGTAKKRFEPIRMPAQAAVPLALALAEIVSCHFAVGAGIYRGVEVSLVEADGNIRLMVVGPVVPELMPEGTTGLAAIPWRMLSQVAAQLRGRVTARIDDGRSTVELVFPRHPA